MGYRDIIDYLYGLQHHGIKFGLENTKKLLSMLGEPQESFKSVHIAGTNGKGSTAAVMAAILKSAGHRTGLFTSPHLVSFTERIRINDKEIKQDDVIALTGEIREAAEKADVSPTFFEVATVMAFVYFKRNLVDRAVIETGMGGRLDATNVIRPEVTVITSIAEDHKEFLGGSIEEIAREKAGIIKQGVPVVTAGQEPAAMDVIKKQAMENGSALYAAGEDFTTMIKTEEPFRTCFDYLSESLSIDNLVIPLAGTHQAINASLAIKAFELVTDGSGENIKDIIKRSLWLTWPGRLELIAPDILIDGAHNPQAAQALADTLKRNFLKGGPKSTAASSRATARGRGIQTRIERGSYDPMVLVMGVMADKDIKGILSPLLPLADEIIFTAPDYGRAASASELSRCASSLGFKSRTANSVRDAIETARSLNPALILITGSFYTIGEAKEALGESAPLKKVREGGNGPQRPSGSAR